jgi:galactokinase
MAAEPANRSEAIASCLKEAVAVFKEKISGDAMPTVAAYAPGRVNLIGEHTDYNGGCVFPMALHRVTVIVGRRSSSGSCRVITTSTVKGETDVTFPVPTPPAQPDGLVQLPSPFWSHYFQGVVALMSRGVASGVPPFEAVISTCVPIGGGLSSSAALEVATCLFVEELCRQEGIALPPRTKQDNALLCQMAEHRYAGAPCGIMDQFVSILAEDTKALYIDCRCQPDGNYLTESVPLPLLTNGLVVLITNSNVKHNVGDGTYKWRRDKCFAACDKLKVGLLRDISSVQKIEELSGLLSHSSDGGPSEYACAKHVVSEIQRTIEAREALKAGDFRLFGQLMNESHISLRDLYKVSCEELDRLVELAKEDSEGVYGSRLTGAGFGGCTVTLLKKEAVDSTIQRMKVRIKLNS